MSSPTPTPAAAGAVKARHTAVKVSRPRPGAALAICLAAVAAATAGRWVMDAFVGGQFPFLTFFVAVALVTWYAGHRAGMVVLAACGAVAWFFFLPPGNSWSLDDSAATAGLTLFAGAGLVLIALFESRRRAWLHAASRAELLDLTLGSIGDGVITTDARGAVTHQNPAASRLTGWDAGEALGRRLEEVMEVVDGVTGQPVAALSCRTTPDGAAAAAERPVVLRHRHGGERWIECNAAPLPCSGEAGQVIVFRDVTDRCRNQRDAEAGLEKAQLVADAVPALISYISRDYRYQLNNRAYETWFNRPIAEVQGRTLESVLGRAAWERIKPHADAALRGETVYYEAEVPYRNNGTRWIAATYTPDADGPGEVRGFVAHVSDITPHKRAEQALRESEERLREEDRRKDEFLATLAHELRNPLAPLRNGLELMKAGGEVAGRARATVERQITHMVRLIDDLLDVSRINSGRLELKRERLDLRELLTDVAGASRPCIAERGHRFHLELPDEPVRLDGDPVRLTQVFGNLLNNAAKYTNPGGEIAMCLERDGEEAVVRVKDSGIGIPRENLAKVFDLFTQLDSSLEKSAGGLGIGLSLVQRLVAMHGGTATAHSEGPGRGSEFICRMPVTTAAEEKPAPSRTGLAGKSALKILVVDDNRDSADTLAMLLDWEGHETCRAYDGPDAVAAAERFRPQVIVLDIGLPGMSGLEVCRALRTRPWARGLTVVALTGWGQAEDQHRTRDAGFDAHLVKPVDPAALYELLGSLPAARA